MVAYLGIDGGGSGCRAVLADGAGTVIGRGAAGPANIHSDPAGALAAILAASHQALGGTDLAAGDLVAVLGLAGANVAADAARTTAALPFGRARIVSDAQTATRGALGTAPGLVAAIGTGSVFARQDSAGFRQFGGRGFVLGDEGSGAVLGRGLLAEALRAADGFAPPSPLLAELLDEMGGADGAIGFASRATPAEFARLAPRVLEGDPGAARVFARAVDEVRAILRAIRGDDDLPVVFLGGLGPAYAAALERDFRVQAPLGTALDGALAMAMEG